MNSNAFSCTARGDASGRAAASALILATLAAVLSTTSTDGGGGIGTGTGSVALARRLWLGDAGVLAGAARAVAGGQGGGALLQVPGLEAGLTGAGDGESKDGVCVSVTVTVVSLASTDLGRGALYVRSHLWPSAGAANLCETGMQRLHVDIVVAFICGCGV